MARHPDRARSDTSPKPEFRPARNPPQRLRLIHRRYTHSEYPYYNGAGRADAPNRSPPRARFMLIAIEGCLGSGKSTVAVGLSALRGSAPLLEDFESNPFLRAFYADPTSNATETEFAFLLLHFHQLKNHFETVSRSEVVADFHLGKDLIYADLNLQDSRAKRMFDEMYDFFLEKTPRPSLMIFLSTPTDLLLKRIRARRRDFELEADPEYYAAVNSAYELFFEQYTGNKLRIPMDEWDFVQDATLFGRLSLLVDRSLEIK